MACTTRARVCSSTFAWPLDTRDTVCDDTPASRATSAIEGRGAPAAVILVRVMSSRVSPVADVRPKKLCLRVHVRPVYVRVNIEMFA